jgi:hypothetical protein
MLLRTASVVCWSEFLAADQGSIPGTTRFFWEAVGLARGPLSLVSTTEELRGRNSSGSGLENWDYGRRRSGALTVRHTSVHKSCYWLRRQAEVARSIYFARGLRPRSLFYFVMFLRWWISNTVRHPLEFRVCIHLSYTQVCGYFFFFFLLNRVWLNHNSVSIKTSFTKLTINFFDLYTNLRYLITKSLPLNHLLVYCLTNSNGFFHLSRLRISIETSGHFAVDVVLKSLDISSNPFFFFFPLGNVAHFSAGSPNV